MHRSMHRQVRGIMRTKLSFSNQPGKILHLLRTCAMFDVNYSEKTDGSDMSRHSCDAPDHP